MLRVDAALPPLNIQAPVHVPVMVQHEVQFHEPHQCPFLDTMSTLNAPLIFQNKLSVAQTTKIMQGHNCGRELFVLRDFPKAQFAIRVGIGISVDVLTNPLVHGSRFWQWREHRHFATTEVERNRKCAVRNSVTQRD